MKKYDLVVVGGGISGVAAAVSSAREGLSVLLVEKSGCLGGALSLSLVFPFMPFATFSSGEEHPYANCCLDENFKKRLSEDIAEFAKMTEPAFIITEDDFALYSANGCYCQKHLDAFAKKWEDTIPVKRL